jgi:hypothetical protein
VKATTANVGRAPGGIHMQWGGDKPGAPRKVPWPMLGMAVLILLVLYFLQR